MGLVNMFERIHLENAELYSVRFEAYLVHSLAYSVTLLNVEV